MNVFLTSLMHPDTANDYNQVLENFELTARSICSQLDQEFLLIVVCCKIPDIEFQHENIVFHVVNFFPADKNDQNSKALDKGVKMVCGLIYIEKYKPDFVYICDADDWISNKINGFLKDNESAFGFCSSSGYLIDINRKEYIKKFGLHRFSGSTFAINYRKLISALELAEHLNEKSSKEDFLSNVPESILLGLIHSHRYLEFFKERGHYFKSLPFPSVAWIRNTGDNMLGEGHSVQGIHLTKRILSEFGLSSAINLDEKKSNPISRYITFYSSALISLIGSSMNLRHKRKT